MTLVAKGNWEVVGDKDWFAVELVAGKSYRIEIVGPDGKVVRVRDPNGQSFSFFNGEAESDPGSPQTGDEENNPGHFTPRTSGTYYFSAEGEATGQYSMKIFEVADDFADNVDSKGVFTNNVASGVIEQPGDSDFFNIDLTAFTQYDYSLNVPSGLEVIITNADGIPVHFGETSGTFVPTVAGRYSFVVVAPNEAAGFAPKSYSLTLTPSPTTDDFANNTSTTGVIPLTVGADGLASGAKDATWNYVTDSDWFAVQLVANQTYSIGIDGVTGDEQGFFSVLDANGNFITTSSSTGVAFEDGNNTFAFTPTTSGTYYVASQALGVPGGYTATVQQVIDDFTDNPNRPGSVTVNSQASGLLQANQDTDWFAVTLTAGQSYTLTGGITEQGSDYFGTSHVVGPNGARINGPFTAVTSGTYYVAYTGLAFAPEPADAAYNVGINSYVDDFADNSSRAGSLAVGGSASGVTEVGNDTDWFAVTLTAGERYVFSTSGVGSTLNIVDSTGWTVGDVRSFTPTVSGTYYLAHTKGAPGAYTVSAQAVPDDFLDNVGTTGRFSGSGAGTIAGTEGADRITGVGGNEVINGLGGDDTLDGGAGNDTLNGDAGADTLIGGVGFDRLVGGAGRDALYGETEGDVLLGGADGDLLFGGAGEDELTGEDGDDYLDGGSERDILNGGAGRDDLRGGEGNDSAFGGTENDLLFGEGGDDELRGEDGDDYLAGGAGRDFLTGDAGADTLLGGADTDVMLGGIGEDIMFGEDGDDALDGGADRDVLFGGAGADNLVGADGNDSLLGGEGLDILRGDAGDDELRGGDGDDNLTGGNGRDFLVGDGGGDALFGGDDGDVLLGADGDDVMFGENGDDYAEGGSERDIVYGGAGRDTLYGGLGNDSLLGEADGDFLLGDAGEDELRGGSGDDYLAGGADRDYLFGDADQDTLYGGLDGDILSGGDGNDFVFGEDGEDNIEGDAGRDVLFGGGARDYMFGGLDDDALLGGEGGDILFGGDGGDELRGETGDDYLDGGQGNDLLFGGAGADTLIGGAGADRFAFSFAQDSAFNTAPDYIADFNRGEGDLIDLTQIDAIAGTAEDNAFTFIGNAAFSNKAGELRFDVVDGRAQLLGDTNGDSVADFSFVINEPAPVLQDFLM